MTFGVDEAVTDETGSVTAREGAADLLTLVDPDAMAKPFAPWETRTIRLHASLAPGADGPRQVFATIGSDSERRSVGSPAPTAVTFRVSSLIEIVPNRD